MTPALWLLSCLFAFTVPCFWICYWFDHWLWFCDSSPLTLWLWFWTPVPWLTSVFISGHLTLVPWLQSCDSMPPSLYYFWSHDSGPMIPYLLLLWLLTPVPWLSSAFISGRLTPVLWLRSCDCVTPIMWLYASKSVLFLVAWFWTCYCFNYWLRFRDSLLFHFWFLD